MNAAATPPAIDLLVRNVREVTLRSLRHGIRIG